MTLVDTPDYQRGIVSAQKLLADVPIDTASVTVGLPPNCETLVVVMASAVGLAPPLCTGVTSGIEYRGAVASGSPLVSTSPTFFFDVSDAIDDQVEISWPSGPGEKWYVYSDAGVHGTVDLANNRDLNGSVFTVPTIPYGRPGSHPPQELSWGHFTPSATQNILAAPGAGTRYRILAASMASAAVGLLGLLYDTTTGQGFFTSAGAGSNSLHLPPQGVPISVNGPLGYAVVGGSGAMVVAVLYTTETV